MNLVISKCVTAVKVSNFTCHYLGKRSPLDIGVLGYVGIVQHKEHSPEVWSVPPVTPCIYTLIWLLPYTQLQDFIRDSRLEDLCDIYVAVSATEVT